MDFNINNLLRDNIKKMAAYSSARNEYTGIEGFFLDANENSFASSIQGSENFHRYPDPLQTDLKQKIAQLKGLPVNNIFIGNGSDEPIDLLFRAFCSPAKDNVIICPPTYGMYEVSANLNDILIKKVFLTKENFQLDTETILSTINSNTKLIFICCPNNPTGNGVKWQDIKMVLERFTGIVVIDEAYIDFASYASLLPELKNYPNLVILQTLSKAWALAGLRIGLAFASHEIITLFNKIKPPYNINTASQKLALEALANISWINDWVRSIIYERNKLSVELSKLPIILKVYPSEANFLLVKTVNALAIYSYLKENKIIVRNRSGLELCHDCLRITIGTAVENALLLKTLKKYKS